MNREMREPEVGDIWKYEDGSGIYVRVMDVDEDTVKSFIILGDYAESGTFRKKEFLEDHSYLGKSKYSVEQFFEIKE